MTSDDIDLINIAIRRIEEGFSNLELATYNKELSIRKVVGTIMADFYATIDFELIPAIEQSYPELDVERLKKIEGEE